MKKSIQKIEKLLELKIEIEGINSLDVKKYTILLKKLIQINNKLEKINLNTKIN